MSSTAHGDFITRLLPGSLPLQQRFHYSGIAVACFCAFLIVGMWYLTLDRIEFERQQAIEMAHNQNSTLALAYEEHVTRTVRAADQMLQWIAHSVEGRDRAPLIQKLLENAAADTSQYAMVGVVDERGYLAYSSSNVRGQYLGDRDYFQAHRQGYTRFYLDKPIQGRISAGWILPISRRISNPDGSFGGVAVIAIRPDYFTDFYGKARLGKHGLVAFIGMDGIARARRSGDVVTVGNDVSRGSIFSALALADSGNLSTGGLTDGRQRFASFRRIASFPGVVAVGVSMEETLQPVDQRASAYYLAAGAGSVTIVLFAIGYFSVNRRHWRAVDALIRSEAAFSEAQRLVRLGNWEFHLNGRVPTLVHCSDEVVRILGYVPGEVRMTMDHFFSLVHDQDRERLRGAVRKAIVTEQALVLDFRVVRPDGEVRDTQGTLKVARAPGGDATRIIGTLRDITDQKTLEAQLLRQANFDVLTGLPNRRLFRERLVLAVKEAAKKGVSLAVLFLDLDRFKSVNDTLGHASGDELLVKVSQRLVGCMRSGDTVARLGGDEFGIVIVDVRQPQDTGAIAQKLISAVQQPIMLSGHEVLVTTSIGISTYPGDSADVDALMKNADTAMYRAKEIGPNVFQSYTEEMSRQALDRLVMMAQLKHAVDRGEFAIEYQPRVDAQTRRVTGCEALLRWRRDGADMAQPGVFVPLLESSGLTLPVGEWVMQQVCRQLAQWRDEGCELVPVSINVSARQFENGALVDCIRKVLFESGVSPRLVEMEITEGTAMCRPEEAIKTLRAIRELGVGLAIDDFGTGYSSLSYLKRFPIDVLKIDRSFVRGLPDNADDASITRAIIMMARSLDVTVVAEGVENQEQANFLVSIGCNELQGYYFDRPLSAADMQRRLRDTKRVLRAV